MKKFGNVLWGIVLIVIGVIIGGNATRNYKYRYIL